MKINKKIVARSLRYVILYPMSHKASMTSSFNKNSGLTSVCIYDGANLARSYVFGGKGESVRYRNYEDEYEAYISRQDAADEIREMRIFIQDQR